MLIRPLIITNTTSKILLFKGRDFYIVIQPNQLNYACQIPADSADGNLAILRRDAPFLMITENQNAEGTPTNNRTTPNDPPYETYVEPVEGHNGLHGLQGGGVTNQFYHLTAAEHSFLSGQNQPVKTTDTPEFEGILLTGSINIDCG